MKKTRLREDSQLQEVQVPGEMLRLGEEEGIALYGSLGGLATHSYDGWRHTCFSGIYG